MAPYNELTIMDRDWTLAVLRSSSTIIYVFIYVYIHTRVLSTTCMVSIDHGNFDIS